MSDITTCRICLQKIQQEPELELNDLTPRPKFEFESEQDLSITENPVACNKCKVEIDSDSYFVKEEIKREEDIKTEDLVDDDCTLLNNKIPLCVEENKPVIVLYYCDKCGYDTDDKKNLTDHVFTHRFKCNRCSYTTPDNYSRIIHKQIHGISQSSIRNYTSNSLDSVRLSVNEEKTNKGSFQCHACDYRSVSKTTLMFHMKTHKMILCDLCNFQTHSRSSLNCHRLTVHKIGSADNIALKNRNSEQITEATAKKRFNRIKIIKCELSTNPNYFGRPFLRMGRLISKKTMHFEHGAFKCRFCDFTTTNIRLFKYHWNIVHTGRRQYSCDMCTYQTYSNTEFRRHKNNHYDKDIIRCSLCNYISKSFFRLKAHLTEHSIKQTFNCDKCDYKTKNQSDLQSHKIMHSEQNNLKRYFIRNPGDVETYNKLNLERQNLQSEEKLLECALCEYSCNFPSSLKSHLVKHDVNV
ncbi:hypothetical protein FQR65_LT12260 [Abscondita terminalis]|nr:hypothetical protein FQR65_LT12260 [Abscondita terminalis]